MVTITISCLNKQEIVNLYAITQTWYYSITTKTLTMRIGTDVSLETCRKEGYLMMEYKKRELIIKGELQKDVDVEFIEHYPDYVLKEMYGTENPIGVPRIMTSINLSANEVWEAYKSDKESIDKCAGLSYEFPTNEYELLSLASDVNGYKGIS